MSKLPPPPRVAKSREAKGLHPAKQAELARMIGVDRKVIQWHRKKSKDAPKDLDPEAWKVFLAAKGRGVKIVGAEPEGLLAQMARLKLSILRTKDEKEKDQLAASRGLLIDRAEVYALHREVIGVDYWAELDRMAFEMPPNLVGLSAAQMFIEFKREKEKIVKNITEKLKAWEAKQEAKRND